MEPKPRTVSNRTILSNYLREAIQHPYLLVVIYAMQIVTQVTALISPLYLRDIFNTLASHDTSSAVMHGLFVSIEIICGISLIQWAAGRIQAYANIYFQQTVISRLYLTSFEYLIKHSHHFFTSQFAGTLTRRVGRYGAAFETICDAILDSFFSSAVFVIGAIAILFARNHTLGVLLAVWAICFIIIQVFLSRLHRPHRVYRAEQDSKMTGALADAIGNQNTITLFAGVRDERRRFEEFVDRYSVARIRAWTYMANIWAVQNLLMVVINVALLFVAVIFWQKGELTVGDFVLIETYLIGTFALLNNITQRLRGFYDALSDAEEMVTIFNTPHEIADIPKAVALKVARGTVTFRNVTFSFNPDRPILKDFSLDIPPSQKVALVGPSGAGKSTITKLALRLYDVTSGSIEIDGQSIRAVTQDSLRNAVAFVPQEPILFHRSLLENIRYGKRDATDQEVITAAKKAHCHEFIMELPEGYNTFVGERGVKLSGGERQRVAIARAILKDAPILILDEATSSLDSESEALIQDSLKVLMQGKTVLVIAHRLSTIMNMDRIVVIDDGRVVADGTHDELLARGGLYQKLWSIQAGGFIQDEDEEKTPVIEEDVE